MKIQFLKTRLSIEGDPMGIMQLSALAKLHGHQTDLTLLTGDYLEEIAACGPDMLAVSLMSSEYKQIKKALTGIRAAFPKLPIIAGGPHATFVPSAIDDLTVDAVCVGEGEGAFLDLIERIKTGADFDNIPNIQTRTSKNALRPLIADLDSLPFLDREIVYAKSQAMRMFRMRSFYSSRGCPYHCTYCFNHAFNKMYRGLGRVVRKRSVDNLLDEMELVANTYPTDFIKVVDDSFVHGVDAWLEEFAEKYRSRIRLPFYCLMRADVVTPELVKLLKYAGVVSVFMSIETGNFQIRKEVLKRNVSNEQIIRAFDLFNAERIGIFTNNMLGLPGATRENEIETLDLNIRCKPSCGQFFIMVPFPGTEIHDYCVKNNCLPKNLGMDQVNESTGMPSMLTNFTPEQKRFHKNLTLLGPAIIRWPRLRDFALKHLLDLPTNIVFSLIHFLTRNYLFKRYIVPLSLSLKDYAVLGWSLFTSEIIQIGLKKKS